MGNSVHGEMPAASITSAGVQTSRAAEPVTSTAAVSKSAIVAWPGRLTVLKAPVIPSAAACSSQRAKSRQSMYLHGQAGRPWREDVAAALDPPQPPGHPANPLIGSENQACPGQQGVRAEALLGSELSAALGRCIVIAIVAGRIASHDGPRFVQADRVRPRVNRSAGNVAVVASPAS
jgi:hypothetical protein